MPQRLHVSHAMTAGHTGLIRAHKTHSFESGLDADAHVGLGPVGEVPGAQRDPPVRS
jgi:hypothetical protein